MKKIYLMMTVAVIALASCSSHDEWKDQSKTQEEKYSTVFQKAFGTVNKAQTWGFTDQKRYVFDEEGKLVATKGEFANANQWSDVFENVPAVPTDDEIAKVTAWFTNNDAAKYAVSVNWSDFFVWQISSQGYGTTNMDQLKCGPDKEHLYHMNNFNAGTCSDNGWHGRSMCMQNVGTAQFTFECSLDNVRHTYYDHFVCIPGSVIDESLANYYYVGFDFESDGTTEEKKIARDYVYNDWIVRIVPGEYKDAQRVMVEDVFATEISDDFSNVKASDWDFNDVVFDVVYTNEWVWNSETNSGKTVNYAVITLRAAGGTLPITVAGKDVHEAFGAGVKDMINTGDGVTRPIVIFRVETESTDPNDIKVLVNGSTELKADLGKATQKLVVPSSVKWVKEHNNITLAYPGFKEYVTKNTSNWYDNVNASYVY